ncbi:TIC40 [Scenedesmus sp. PABB004]|nr:TIC40 [Scenedesmus sp. PABB004]
MPRSPAAVRLGLALQQCGGVRSAAAAGAGAGGRALLLPAIGAARHAPARRAAPWREHAWLSSQAGGDGGEGEGVVAQLDSMVEVMLSNPAMQQMMLARMPPHMRKPEVLRAMMANPEVRQRIAALAKQSGLDRMLSQLDAAKMASGLSASSRAGLDPAALFERFSQSPTLAPRMNDPRVLAALMDLASNGPDALKKYSGDQEVVEAAMEAGDIITAMQQEQEQQAGGSGGAAAAAAPASSPGGVADAEAQLGMRPEELMQRLMARPDLLAKVQDPKVQQALQEVSASPWKIVKYLFNKDVMAAIKEMKDMLQQPPAK